MRHLLWPSVFGLLFGAAIYYSSTANADPADPQVTRYVTVAAPVVCEVLDEYPTIDGVAGVMRGVMDDSGFTVKQSAMVVVLSVNEQCPKFMPLLREFANSGKASVTA
jgi:hypothetical protein